MRKQNYLKIFQIFVALNTGAHLIQIEHEHARTSTRTSTQTSTPKHTNAKAHDRARARTSPRTRKSTRTRTRTRTHHTETCKAAYTWHTWGGGAALAAAADLGRQWCGALVARARGNAGVNKGPRQKPGSTRQRKGWGGEGPAGGSTPLPCWTLDRAASYLSQSGFIFA